MNNKPERSHVAEHSVVLQHLPFSYSGDRAYELWHEQRRHSQQDSFFVDGGMGFGAVPEPGV